jgi:hypothetical protein
MINLTEFTTDQLNTYITLVEESLKDWDHKRRMVVTKVCEGEIKNELISEYTKKCEDLTLLRVQLLNARIERIKMNIVNSN